MSDAERIRRAVNSRVRRAPRDAEEEAERRATNAAAIAAAQEKGKRVPDAHGTLDAAAHPTDASNGAVAVVSSSPLASRHVDDSALGRARADELSPLRLHGEDDDEQDDLAVIQEVLETSVAPDPYDDHPLARSEALAAMVHGGARAFGLSRLPQSFHALSGADKLDWLLALPDPRASIQALPAEELVFLIDEIGLADAGELLGLASARQLQAAVDLDVWRRDRLDRRAFAHLLAVAVAAGSEVVDRLLAAQEDGLLTSFLMRSAMVFEDAEEAEQCPPEDWELFTTPSGEMMIAVDSEDAALGPIRVILESLYRVSIERGRRVVRAVRWELSESLEEDLYDHRSRRLADLGFTSRDEARELYLFVDPAGLRQEVEQRLGGVSDLQPDALRPYLAEAAEYEAVPGYDRTDLALRSAPEPGFLAEAAARLSDAEQARVQTALVFLAYRVQAALSERFDDTTVLADNARHALTMVDLGLRFLARARPDVGAAILATHRVDLIFGAGHGQIVGLHHRAGALRRRLGAAERGALLDGRDGEIVRALLRPLPLWPRTSTEIAATGQDDQAQAAHADAGEGGTYGSDRTRADVYDDDDDGPTCQAIDDSAEDEDASARAAASQRGLRPFERASEVESAGKALLAVSAQITLLERAADDSLPAALDTLSVEIGERASDLSMSSLLATAVAWAVLDRSPRIAALDAAAVSRLLREAMEGQAPHRHLRSDVRSAISRALLLLPELDDVGAAALEFAVAAALDRLDSELGGLEPNRPIDLRFIGSALVLH